MLEQQTAPTVRYRHVGGVGLVAAILMGLNTALTFVHAWTMWNAYYVVHDFLAGDPRLETADVFDADRILRAVSWAVVLSHLAAAVVFLVWLWRARCNAEALCEAPHRRRRGWTIGSWFVPVISCWYPYQIVDDIYRASRPGSPRDLWDLQTVPGTALLRWWWGMYLASLIIDRITAAAYVDAKTVEDLQAVAVTQSAQAVLLVGAAVIMIIVMRRIILWQQAPRPAVVA